MFTNDLEYSYSTKFIIMTSQQAHQKASTIKNLIRSIAREEVDIPQEALVFLDLHTLLQVVTERRVEIIEIIAKHNPHSIQQIVDLTKRKKQAVDRDIKILEKYGVVELIPAGRDKIPKIIKRIVVFNLAESEENDPIRSGLVMPTPRMEIVS